MSSWRGKRRGHSHNPPHTNIQSPAPTRPTQPPQPPQEQSTGPSMAPTAQLRHSTAATSDEAAAVGGKSILNEVLAFMQQSQPPPPAILEQQPPQRPLQQPLPTAAYTPPAQHQPSPLQPLLPAFQPAQPIQPPPGFSRPLPPFNSPLHIQPPPPPFNPSRPPHQPSATAAYGGFPSSSPPRPFPAPIAPPPGFGGVRMGGGSVAGGGGYGGLYSHFAAPQPPHGQPLPYPHSPYAQPTHAPSLSPLGRRMPQHPLQQQQQWADAGGRAMSGAGQSDMESIAAMQRVHLDDTTTQPYYNQQQPLTSPLVARPHVAVPFNHNHKASPMHSSPHSQQPSAFLFQTPQRPPQSAAATQLPSPATAGHLTVASTSPAVATSAWGRKNGGQLFGTSPTTTTTPQPAHTPTHPPASPLLVGGDSSPSPPTPATSTFAPYVPHPSALTQPIKPHLRRGFPSLVHVPQSTHIDQQLSALLSTLIPSSSSDVSRDACRAQLEALVRRVWPTAAVRLFGSSVNLLCDERSDCDLSLLMDEETGVKQSCYNSFIPKPKREKEGKRGKEKDKADTNGSTPAAVDSEQQAEETLGTAQGAAEPDTLSPQQQQAATGDDGGETKPPASPQLNSKQSSSLTVDMLPTLSLSNPTHLQQLALTRTSDEQQPIEPGAVIEKLAAILKTESATLYSDILALPKARVPIVKFHSSQYGYDCDIGVNNLLAIENSRLIRAYMTADTRARQLVFVVKHWAKQRKINDPFRGTLSSYAYVLMTIHYLQQLTPPVLPCLQSYGVRGRVERLVGGYDCGWDERLASEWRSANHSPLSALLSGWYMYYAHCYGYSDDVISVRVGGVLGKREKEREWAGSGKRDKHLLSIEDPFEVSHDLGRVCDGSALFEIRGEMIRGTKMCMEGKSVQSIVAKYDKEWRGS